MTKNLKRFATTSAATISAMVAAATPAFAQVSDVTPPTGFFTDIGELINGVLNFVMVIAALLVFMYLIWGGIEWITSGGDKGKTESARNKITSAVVGLIVLAASYAILLIVLRFLGYSDLNTVFENIGG